MLTVMGDGGSTRRRAGRTGASCTRDLPLGHRPTPRRADHRPAAGLTALVADNERLKAELQTRLAEVQASRARIVEAGDRERRRVERNLHDGAQQRLVGLALALRLIGRTAGSDPSVAGLLAEAAAELDEAIAELRGLARGLHPAIVVDAGLGGAIEALAERPGLPVELLIDLPTAVPEAVAVGAYYFVAEALANANRHSGAELITVRARVVDGLLKVVVADDGCGGATITPGSGLEGLLDRIGALGGQLVIASREATGTRLMAEIPLRDGPCWH